MKKWHWILLILGIIFMDQLTKYWVQMILAPYHPVPVLPIMNLTLAYNTGAAFSFLSGAGDWHRWFFTFFSSMVSLILLIWLWRTPNTQRIQLLGIGLVLSGAIGNLIDRLTHGYVIDFIDFYYDYHHFATFNLADAAICIGAAVLVMDLIIHGEGASVAR